jgi:predicted AlkP superfamily phosphohydrolase/phosphomutase
MPFARSSNAQNPRPIVAKVFVIGLDGATFDLILPWAAQGKLPNLNRLIEGGVLGPLESTIPPMTSPAWPSFATGKYPSKHGVFDFVSAHNGSFKVVNATAVDARPLWDILSAYGKRVGVVNVPVTYPPHPVNGFLISGLLSPSGQGIAYPADLLRRYEGASGDGTSSPGGMPRYRVVPSIQYKPGNEEVYCRDLELLVDERAAYAVRLMDDHAWDFFMVHFLATDLAQHALWRHMDPSHPHHEPGNPFQDAIQRVYRRADAAIGALLDRLDDDTTVIVMSDHGFGPLHGVVNLNMLLWREGLLHFKRTPLAQLRSFTFRHGLTPALAYRWLNRLNLQNILSRVSKSTRNAAFNKFLSFDDVDWSRTIAYSLGHMGQIYLNIKGREEHGIVERNGRAGSVYNYDRCMERVIQALQTLTTPDGRPMLDRVIHQSSLALGEHLYEGPDLHVVLDGYRYISCPLFANDGHIISRQIRGDSGSHRTHGIFIAYGPQVRPGAAVQDAQIVDLAPTVLSLLGCPIPADMDGRVLTEILSGTQQPVVAMLPAAAGEREQHSLSEDEDAELQARLKGFGYLG